MRKPKVADAGDHVLDVQLQIRVSPALRDKLRRRAFHEQRSLTATARLLIEQGLKRPRVEAAE
jgi:hypothetical protein